MAKGKPKRKPFGMNSSLADATQVMRQLPVSAMLSSIEMQINILQERGVEIRDWENKDRVLKQVRILGGKAYFLAEDKPCLLYTSPSAQRGCNTPQCHAARPTA